MTDTPPTLIMTWKFMETSENVSFVGALVLVRMIAGDVLYEPRELSQAEFNGQFVTLKLVECPF